MRKNDNNIKRIPKVFMFVIFRKYYKSTKAKGQREGKKGKKQGILKGRLLLENYISVEQKLRNSSVKQIVIEITVLK